MHKNKSANKTTQPPFRKAVKSRIQIRKLGQLELSFLLTGWQGKWFAFIGRCCLGRQAGRRDQGDSSEDLRVG